MKRIVLGLLILAFFPPHFSHVNGVGAVQGYIKPLSNLSTIKSDISPVDSLEAVYVAPAVSSYSGTGDSSLDWIISHESGGNAFAVNASSGACGLAQELPCGKSGCVLGDAQCEINWMRNYCIERYGSTYLAMLYWQAHGNY